MLRLIVLFPLFAACMGQATMSEHCCSADDRALVAEQWNSIWNTPDSNAIKVIVGHAIFDRFLAEDPEAASLFDRVGVDDTYSGAFHAHMLRVLGGVDIMINVMRDSAILQEEAAHLAAQHRVREGVTVARIKHFTDIMLDELPKVLVEFNDDAWASCFAKFFTVIGN